MPDRGQPPESSGSRQRSSAGKSCQGAEQYAVSRVGPNKPQRSFFAQNKEATVQSIKSQLSLLKDKEDRIVAHLRTGPVVDFSELPFVLEDMGILVVAQQLKSNSSQTKQTDGQDLPPQLTLKSLRVQNSGITAQGAAALGKVLATDRVLESLDISSNPIGDDGVCALASALAVNHTLTSLDISSVQFTDRGAHLLLWGLRQNRTLRNLSSKGNALSTSKRMEMATVLRGRWGDAEGSHCTGHARHGGAVSKHRDPEKAYSGSSQVNRLRSQVAVQRADGPAQAAIPMIEKGHDDLQNRDSDAAISVDRQVPRAGEDRERAEGEPEQGDTTRLVKPAAAVPGERQQDLRSSHQGPFDPESHAPDRGAEGRQHDLGPLHDPMPSAGQTAIGLQEPLASPANSAMIGSAGGECVPSASGPQTCSDHPAPLVNRDPSSAASCPDMSSIPNPTPRKRRKNRKSAAPKGLPPEVRNRYREILQQRPAFVCPQRSQSKTAFYQGCYNVWECKPVVSKRLTSNEHHEVVNRLVSGLRVESEPRDVHQRLQMLLAAEDVKVLTPKGEENLVARLYQRDVHERQQKQQQLTDQHYPTDKLSKKVHVDAFLARMRDCMLEQVQGRSALLQKYQAADGKKQRKPLSIDELDDLLLRICEEHLQHRQETVAQLEAEVYPEYKPKPKPKPKAHLVSIASGLGPVQSTELYWRDVEAWAPTI